MRQIKTLSSYDKKRALEDIEVLIEISREPFLVLDINLKIIEANPSFYKTFKVKPKETKGKYLYDLGNKQWDISQLKDLLENILPEKKMFTDFEVTHKFPSIGKRVFLLNGRQLDSVQLIVLAFEDVTEKRKAEDISKKYTKNLEIEVAKRTKELNSRIKDLEELTQVMVGRELKMSELKREIARVKKLKKLNGNGKIKVGL